MAVLNKASIEDDINAVSRIPVISKILEVVCRTTGMGFAVVARVTDQQWVACAVRDEINFGLEVGGELRLETTICHEIRQTGQQVVIDHAAKDEYFAKHHTPLMYGFQSYISVPIKLKDGSFFGTLCSIDPKPAVINTPETIGMFQLFAELIAFHLNALAEHRFTESQLREEQTIAELREQFIAILGHDLRNPVQATLNGAQLLQELPVGEQGLRIARIIQDSSYRINGLIENMLDFASGRLGGGIVLHRKPDIDIKQLLSTIVTEMNVVWPGRTVDLELELAGQVDCDPKRIGQLFSNLLGNALSYGEKEQAVTVRTSSTPQSFVLTVANAGKKIPQVIMHRLFRPFSRGEVTGNKEGLGLGLYIASQIAVAHHGNLDVVSTDEQTIFTLTIPQPPK